MVGVGVDRRRIVCWKRCACVFVERNTKVKSRYINPTDKFLDELRKEINAAKLSSKELDHYVLVNQFDLMKLVMSHNFLARIEGQFTSGNRKMLNLMSKTAYKIEQHIKGFKKLVP